MNKKLYFPNLDASRFFAFILVFLAHCFVSTDSDIKQHATFIAVYDYGKVGLLGLEYFFVLSSFLISRIILEEKDQTNNFNVFHFLMRRTLRVWPLYFLMIFIGFLITYLAGIFNHQISPLPEWPYLIFFLVNFYIISHDTEFLFFIAFLWSISVEEQFYLVWAFFMKFIYQYFTQFCWLLIFISLIFRYLYYSESDMLYFHTISALGNFGIGGLLAHSMYKKKNFIENISAWNKTKVLLTYLLIICSIVFFHELMEIDVFRLFSRMIYSLFFAYVILEQSIGKNQLFRMGRWPLISYLGKVSYGLYCFHGLVITLMLQALPYIFPDQSLVMSFLLFPLIIFLFTLLFSHISYRYFERYFLNLKNKFYSFQP